MHINNAKGPIKLNLNLMRLFFYNGYGNHIYFSFEGYDIKRKSLFSISLLQLEQKYIL